MNKAIKKLWVAALKSKRYKQGYGQLKRKDKYCCLGVLCDLHASKTNQRWEYNSPFASDIYLNQEMTLPQEVVEWAGLTHSGGLLPEKCKTSGCVDAHEGKAYLWRANDQAKKSFEQIANLINRWL